MPNFRIFFESHLSDGNNIMSSIRTNATATMMTKEEGWTRERTWAFWRGNLAAVEADFWLAVCTCLLLSSCRFKRIVAQVDGSRKGDAMIKARGMMLMLMRSSLSYHFPRRFYACPRFPRVPPAYYMQVVRSSLIQSPFDDLLNRQLSNLQINIRRRYQSFIQKFSALSLCIRAEVAISTCTR